MSADEKAKGLITTFGRELALLVIDEIITAELQLILFINKQFGEIERTYNSIYWQQVKEAIRSNLPGNT